MTLAELNPFVRYAERRSLQLSPTLSYSYDHRLLYLHNGNATLVYNGVSHTAGGGSLLIWPSGQPYRLDICDGTMITILNFDYTQEHSELEHYLLIAHAENYDPDDVLEHPSFNDCPALSGLLILPAMHRIEDSLAGIVEEYNNRQRYWQENAGTLLRQILLIAARASFVPGEKSRSTVDQVMAFLHENYARPITNRDIAEHVNYHEFHINKLVQHQTGQTLHRCLLRIRVENATQLLLGTDWPIAKIAEQTGFSSAAYFSDAFHRMVGQSPADFRRSRGNQI